MEQRLRAQRFLIFWLVLSGLTHATWELSWCFVSGWLHGPQASSGWRRIWSLYGVADRRYLHSDPFILILELVTGTICATLNLYVACQLARGRTRRALPALLIVSVMEVYGTVMYFGSELFSGFANVNTARFVDTWIKFFGLNVLWLIVPGFCIYEVVLRLQTEARHAVPDSAVQAS